MFYVGYNLGMKMRLLLMAFCLCFAIAGCNKNQSTTSPERAFDMNVILGMTETQLVALLGEPDKDLESTFSSGFIRSWTKGGLVLQISFNRSGYPTAYVCYDNREGAKPSYESLRQEFNVSATDTRYKLTYGAPDKDGAVTIMHVKRR